MRKNNPSSNQELAALRIRLRQLEAGRSALTHAPAAALPLALPAIDLALPEGGLARGALHEILGSPGDGAATGFAVFLLARLGAVPVLWIARAGEVYGPALAALGLDPGRLILVEIASRKDRLWACAEALRNPGLGAVLAEIEGVALVESRRLQLAAEAGGGLGLLLRSGLEAGASLGAAGASAARSRWRVASLPSRPGASGVGGPRWRLELLHCRGGRPGSWAMTWQKGEWDAEWSNAPATAEPAAADVALAAAAGD